MEWKIKDRKKLTRNRIEMERKWNGDGMEKKRQIKWKQNLMEWNRNGMEMEWKTWVKYDFVKWIWKWNGMEMEWRWKLF